MSQDSTAIDTTKSKYKRMYSADDPLFKPKVKEEKDFKKKKDFWGVLLGRKIDGFRTRKGYTQSGRGRNMKYESFRFSKKWNAGSPYVKFKYYYDPFKAAVVKKRKVADEDTLTLRPLHGPYKKIVGEDTIQMGFFYMGMRHGRWMEQKKSREVKFADTAVSYQQLKTKENWYKGWPRDAELIYYESDRSKLKEVIPYMNGEQSGLYYMFFKDARVEAYGKYIDGYKVGKWTAYHNRHKGTIKKSIWSYPKAPYYKDRVDDHYLDAAWDKTGAKTYTKSKK